MSTKLSQRGGGMHSEYCPLCELSYEPLPEIDDDDDEYDDDDGAEGERGENPLKKLANVDVSWLQNGLGFDRDSKTIVPLEGDTLYGEFPIKGRRGQTFTAEMFGEGEFGWGPVFHEDCIACVSAQLKRAVTYEDGIEIFNIAGDGSRARYGDQHFQWRRAVEEEGPAYFYSPMSPKGGDTRSRVLEKIAGWILKQKRVASPNGKRRAQREEAVVELERVRAELNRALAKVEDLRRDVAAREAAVAALSSPVAVAASPVKKGRQTKKRSPKKQPPKKAAAAAATVSAAAASPAAALNCASHKTKETCPPGACVWGKTNRCSKKRS
jgi:hypothetical protein